MSERFREVYAQNLIWLLLVIYTTQASTERDFFGPLTHTNAARITNSFGSDHLSTGMCAPRSIFCISHMVRDTDNGVWGSRKRVDDIYQSLLHCIIGHAAHRLTSKHNSNCRSRQTDSQARAECVVTVRSLNITLHSQDVSNIAMAGFQ
jgi:hypothetical protein